MLYPAMSGLFKWYTCLSKVFNDDRKTMVHANKAICGTTYFAPVYGWLVRLWGEQLIVNS